ncbi:MAG: PLDc N-terminal domain-containing protein [bacterium]
MPTLEPQFLFVIFATLVIVVSVLAALCGIFSVLMLRDCLNRNLLGRNRWLVAITVLNIIGALAYYLRIKRHF